MEFNSRSLPFLVFFSWVQFKFLPEPMLVVFLFMAMLVDLWLGVLKSHRKKIATKSEGLKKTAEKIVLYVTCILGVWILVNVLELINHSYMDYSKLVNYTIAFLTTIEIYSIMENGYSINPNSMLSKYFFKPALEFLKGTLSNHPFNKKGGRQDEV